MQDVYPCPAVTIGGFVFGAALEGFLRWISQQKSDPKQRAAVAEVWRLLGWWGICYSLVMATWYAAERNTSMTKSKLIGALAFAAVFCGAWAANRRRRNRS